ncbi:MAG: LCP family protein, partial [Anaerotardibacter sp.]
KLSLIDIPNNFAVSTSQQNTDRLSNLTRVDGEAALVSHVSDTFGIKINHYIRISDKGFVDYMDSLGGLTVDVTQRIDDPTVSSEVITTGTQTLKGDKILTFVNATNYTDGFTTQAANQQKALEALLKGITSKSGFDYMSSMDALSNAIKTDLSIEGIEEILNVYTASEQFPYAPAPVTSSVINDVHYSYLASSKWSAMSEQFINGEDPAISIDTSTIDKASLSIIVLNASGIDGFAAQVTSVLTSKGYTVQETGNNNYQDFSETLVVYQSNQAAAEAIVEDLGVGRAVAAGFNYALTTEIQVMVGKDWKPLE